MPERWHVECWYEGHLSNVEAFATRAEATATRDDRDRKAAETMDRLAELQAERLCASVLDLDTDDHIPPIGPLRARHEYKVAACTLGDRRQACAEAGLIPDTARPTGADRRGAPEVDQ